MTTDRDTDDEELTERLIFPASKTMAEAIKNYRFEQRIDSKSEAIRRLVAAGLKAEERKQRK